MGVTKTDHYNSRQNRMSVIAKALGHPARIAILEFLFKAKKCICGDIVNALPLAQPTISQHLRELKTAGIIKGDIEGTAICYCIEPKVMTELSEYLLGFAEGMHCEGDDCS